MEKARFNFAWVIAIIALIAYSYISFMGLVYCQFFPVAICALIVIAFDALIVFLVSIMSRAKHTRWIRLGTLGQIFFGLIVLLMLLASSAMFSHFTNIVKQQDDIKKTYASAIVDAQSLDNKYENYIEDRCDNYKQALSKIKPGSIEFKSLFSNSQSLKFSTKEIIDKCSVNLKKLLRGSNDASSLLSKREQWLKNESASVWNLNLPSNIRDITNSVNKWLDNYRELSSVTYVGEALAVPFEDNTFNDNIRGLERMCKEITFPSFLAILLALVSCGLILLPWIITPKNIASVGGDFDDVVEMPVEDE